jgi:DNA-directed RNA polymerase alpha subunit
MDAMLKERVRVTMAKIEIAMGVRDNSNPNIERAQRILDDFARDLSDEGDETPLELLGLPSAVVGYLHSGGVLSVEQLCGMDDSDLLVIEQIRSGRLRVIDEALKRSGLQRPR